MDDMIRRSALLDEIKMLRNQAIIGKTEAARWDKIIRATPAVDAVEVVRCRECRWYDPRTKNCIDGLYGIIEPEWFCADGQRRGDGDGA